MSNGGFTMHAGCKRRYEKEKRWIEQHPELVESRGMERLTSNVTRKHPRKSTDADRVQARRWLHEDGKRVDHRQAADAAAAVLNNTMNVMQWDMMFTSELRLVYLKRLAIGLTNTEKRIEDHYLSQ